MTLQIGIDFAYGEDRTIITVVEDGRLKHMIDPTTNDAVLASLQSRCEMTYPNQNGVFSLASNATTRKRGDSSFQASVLPVTETRIAIAWSAVYRGRELIGTLIVADLSMQSIATAMILQEASSALDMIDMRLAARGFDASYNPSPDPGGF